MKQISLCLILIALTTSVFSIPTPRTIPNLYDLNKGAFTSDYSVTYNSAVSSGEFGFTSEAGDINNDGIPDFTIAHPTFDNNKGIVYVIYGKKGSLRQFNSMSDFQPSDGFIIKGNTDGQKLGFSVSAAGDINGDGVDDLIIGSAFWNGKTGVVHVLFGRTGSSEFTSTIDVDRLAKSQGFKIFGASSMDFAGYSISGAGDVNGDGLSDIIIGAFGANGNSGKAYVIFGSRQGLADMVLPPTSGKGFTIEGSGGENFGASVSKVGDFNGDGVDDLIIGAHCADNWAGKAYVIFGRRGSFPAVIKATEGLTIKGASSYNNLGCTVSGAGDFNGDGLQDVIVGAYGAASGNGAAYVILGTRQNPGVVRAGDLDADATPSKGFRINGWNAGQFGLFVSGGRDLNGDGVSDILIGNPGFSRDRGAVYVVYGSRQSSFAGLIDKDITPSRGYAIYGAKEGDRFGTFARVLKDVNKDGVNDFVVGSFNANNGKGAAYLFYVSTICSANCASCSSTGTCDVCSPGFGFINNMCVSCPTGSYYLNNGVCEVICSANCKKCSRPNTCDFCAQGYGFIDNNNCVICPANTHTLSLGVCQVKCSPNCASCSRPNTCDSCASGFGFLNGECISCPSATHVLSGGFCVGKCSQNCASCSRPGSCDICVAGFGFLGGVCTSCPSTHFLSNGNCVERRPKNCVQWSSPDSCEICAFGFGFLNNECVSCPAETHTLKNGSCVAKCPENCAKCTQPNLCDVCSEGFGFLNDVCQACPEKTHFLNNGFCLEDRDAWQQIKDLFGGLFH